jgi:glycosyltransferase involved in cell wall biosynthesis
MRIVVLDYSGHIPQADLARNLAKLGHNVRHMYCSDYISGRGAVDRESSDPKDLEFLEISIKKDFDRYNPIERIKHELAIAQEFWVRIQEFNPDHTIFSNVPLLAMSRLAKKMNSNNRPYLYWWQDVYSIAIGGTLRKFGPPTWPLRQYLIRLEKNILRGAKYVVAISSNFEPIYLRWKQDIKKFSMYPNWTPINLFPHQEPSMAKSTRKIAVYAGTLGMKHRPELLLHLADDAQFKKLGGVVVVVSQGQGRELLEKPANIRKNIVLKNFLTIPELGQLFAEASVLLAVLEPEASTFSVPSKIMSYLSAGKPIVASIDPENASAKIILDNNAGIVIPPAAPTEDFSHAVTKIISNPQLQILMGQSSTQYARENFDGAKASEFFIQCIRLECLDTSWFKRRSSLLK